MTRKPEVERFLHPATSTFSYVIWDPETRKAAVLDSVLHYEAESGRTSTHYVDQIVQFVRANQLQTQWVLETHVHADHVAGGAHIRHAVGGTTGIGAGVRTVQRHFREVYGLERGFLADGSQFNRLFEDGETFRIGSIDARVIATPGHTPDHLTYLIGDAAFVGDTLFMPDGGTARCDFPGGDAHRLYQSIQRLFKLPDSTRVFLCHDYKTPGRDEYCNETTIAEQRQNNIHVREGITAEEFVAMRTARDATLDMPTLILPSVQVNMRAGELPPAEDNGVRYLKIPLNAL